MILLKASAATIVVTHPGDSNDPGTLRNMLARAEDGDTIDVSGMYGIINLTNGTLVVTNSVTIIGPGPSLLALNGSGGASPVFMFSMAGTVAISGLTITHFSFPGCIPATWGAAFTMTTQP